MSATVAPASQRRILAAAMVGTAIEFYDFYIYATATTLVFAALFFPASKPGAAQLLAFATFGVAFFARPVGAIAFGHFGDRIGRKSTLVTSLLLMGGSTFLISFLPGYAIWGWWAPFILCVLRFGQGFGLGGEWGGAALLANENAPKGWEARYGTAPQQGAPLGFIVANGMMLAIAAVLPKEAFMAWGWRIPFLLSALMVAVGLWIRLKLTETPAFAAALAHAPPPAVPLGVVFRDHWRAVIGGIVASIACFMVFYIATVFCLNYGTKTLGYSYQAFLGAEVAAIPVMGIGVYFSGWLADKHLDPGRVLGLGTCGTIIAGGLLPLLLVPHNLVSVWSFLAISAFVMGMVYGPLGAFLPSLFPVPVRYTGVSVAFNLAAILGGGLTPYVATLLTPLGGLPLVGAYLTGAGVVSLLGLLILARRSR